MLSRRHFLLGGLLRLATAIIAACAAAIRSSTPGPSNAPTPPASTPSRPRALVDSVRYAVEANAVSPPVSDQ
jgi:hypothetical protein